MNRLLTSAAFAAALLGTAAIAQAPTAPANPAPAGSTAASTTPAPATVTKGASVFDTQGGTVGTIEAVDGQYATLATANSKAKLPLTAFAQGEKGLLIGMTAAQVDAAAGPAGASAATAPAGAPAEPVKLAKGGAVSDTKGAPVGTIEEVDGQFAVVATAKNKVRLPLTAFADAGSGPVIGMSAAELDAAADAAKPKAGAK